MIKLNNKNITYVALADTNNSLKAPKEIWYADSNNSVKLVYRRKDALIEGEDYEKYHWLDGDGSAYIDTKVTDLSVSDYIKTIFDDSDNIGVSIRTWGREGNRLIVGNDGSSTSLKVFGNVPSSFVYNNEGIYIYDMYFDLLNDEVTINNQIFTLSLPHNNGLSFLLFARHHNTSPGIDYINLAKYKSFEIHNQINLIPCKLLKPVPKWLDANGIRRQVGECGMIDLVSGKFYGNVNSVGTFTVENYYERKEWLVGDGSAYIDTNVIVNVATLLISTKINRSNSTGKYFIFGSRDIVRSDDPSTSSVVVSPQSFRCDIIDGNNIFDSSSIVSIELSFPTLTINGQSLTTQRVPTTSQNTFRIFTTSVVNSDTYCFNGGISEFVLNDGTHSLNLIPCTLTMDLPASMDANNIARTKGTSGMWDLVSDKFYGNVASSGTFKAVNLAEGVDYEVHQWLVGEINSVGTLQRLPINSSSLSYKVKRINGVNSHFFRTEGYYDYYYQGTSHIAIYDLNQKNVVYRDLSITDYELDFECSAGNVSANGVDIPIYGFPIKEVRFHAADSGGMETYTSSITVDGIERYIPVKLLHSIPSKYDANGIARQAGECGMYDTVNDLFYGNVASSGNFSVSDDE